MVEDELMIVLPPEIIELILVNEQLSINDVFNFAFTCKHLCSSVLSSNTLWRTKLFQR